MKNAFGEYKDEKNKPPLDLSNTDEDTDRIPPLNEVINEADEPDVREIEVDLNGDGIVTPDEQRKYYETTGWKEPYGDKPYYYNPWFKWDDWPERWVNNPEAVHYWKENRGGSVAQFDKLRNSPYPTDFDSKTY